MLKNKLALVTGGASGIGLSIAKLYAEQNATVILVDIQETVTSIVNELKKDQSQEHSAFVCDVSVNDQIQSLFRQIKEKYPTQKVPNVIVNAAGVAFQKPIVETSESEYDRVMDINLKAPFLITQAAAKELIANYDANAFQTLDTYASIINIASILGVHAVKNAFPYAASKAGLIRLTKSSATELGSYKIRVNAVLPGFIQTPMISSDSVKEHLPMIQFQTPLNNRLGEPIEVAQVCLFLASDASSFMTGAELECTGGLFC